ncbi:MAG: hydrogenase maturation protease [Acidobacteriaceae bacterium]
MKNKEFKTLVLGLGNTLMGDEGVGVHVLREVEKRPLPEGVECLDGGTGGFVLLGPLQSADRIVMIDAASDGNPIGTITRVTPRYSSEYPPTLTAHDVGVKDLLDVFYTLGGDCEVVLFAITIDPHQSITLEMSPTVAKAAGEAVELVIAELEGLEKLDRLETVGEVCSA